MAIQIFATSYKLDNTVINPVQYLPFPAGSNIAPATLDDISYVKSLIRYQEGSTWRTVYVSETVSTLVSRANA